MRRRVLVPLCGAVAALLLASACSKDNSTTPTTPTTPTCTVTAATTATSFAAAGGTGTVTVTAGTGCTWTATSSSNFVTITAGASGSGNGTVNFTVAANTGTARTATITVGSTSFSLSQSAAATPAALSAPTANAPVGGTTITVPRPTLVVNNSTPTGTVGTVTYRFEISDQPSFPVDAARTFSVDGIAQGTGGTTSGVVPRDLGPDVLWYWHARSTDGVATSDYSATETFRTPSSCTFAISPTTLSINSTSATATVNVTTTGSSCSWTATSNASFITVLSGGTGTGNGSVLISIQNNSGAARTGTVTIAGQPFTVNQAGGAVAASFQLLDPGTTSGAVTECRIRSGSTPPVASTCTLHSTSVPTGTSTITNYAWTVQYFYASGVTLSQSTASPDFSFQDTCGKTGSSDLGAVTSLLVNLTVTDSTGSTASASSGSGSQPPLSLRLFTCGS
jgi:all-beta uncharacterized protein